MNYKMLPNAITLLNLLLGTVSVIYTLEQRFLPAAVLILVCAVLDYLDGKAARILKAESALGRELDSLADLVSFGVAPAVLVYSLFLQDIALFGLPVTLAFVLCGAVRLARFNVSGITSHFTGVPITVTGSILAGAVLFHHYLILPYYVLPGFFFPSAMLVMSFLMVSKLKVPNWK